MSFLVVDLPTENHLSGEARTVVLGPAIPTSWGGGKVRGLRLRGGGMVDFEWDGDGLVIKAKMRGVKRGVTIVNKVGMVLGAL